MRPCPVCDSYDRHLLWSMAYKIPDGWPLPHRINWHACDLCGMVYGDGDFDQEMLNKYYRNYYGYGVNSYDVTQRLEQIADDIMEQYSPAVRFVDFGGSGDDGKSVACKWFHSHGYPNAYNVDAGEPIPPCDVLLASHVFEHIYDMVSAMEQICMALSSDGLLIVDGPDATGIVDHWGMPILDYHTKHINHFRLIDYLRLMENCGYELSSVETYVDIRANQRATCQRMYYRRRSTAEDSARWVQKHVQERLDKLAEITQPVNVWGLGDIAWHLLAQADLNVLEYIDNDPAYRGKTYDGKPVLERPTNAAPIVIMSQGQRHRLLENIRKAGVTNEIIEV